MDVSKFKKNSVVCNKCDGKGELPIVNRRKVQRSIKCNACGGSGHVRWVHPLVGYLFAAMLLLLTIIGNLQNF